MGLWNDELVSHALSSTRRKQMTYISGLENVIEPKKLHLAYSFHYLTPKRYPNTYGSTVTIENLRVFITENKLQVQFLLSYYLVQCF